MNQEKQYIIKRVGLKCVDTYLNTFKMGSSKVVSADFITENCVLRFMIFDTKEEAQEVFTLIEKYKKDEKKIIYSIVPFYDSVIGEEE